MKKYNFLLGKRFAQQQIKIGIIHLVKNFIIRVNEKTKRPLEIDPRYLLLDAKGGIWLSFEKRE